MSAQKYCDDKYPAHDPGGCPDCAPRIVAECWTCPDCNCGWDKDRSHFCTNLEPPVPLYTKAGVTEHRAAGHDVREVIR